MKMIINKLKLELLLEKKRDNFFISLDGIDMIITGIIFVLSLLCSEYKSFYGIKAEYLECVSWVIAIGIIGFGSWRLWYSWKSRYTHEQLLKDIKALDEVLHRFSIVAIKDTFHSYANRFLLYYDKVWECWFFFSFHTEKIGNEEAICQRLSNKLKVDVDNIQVSYITDRIQPKYSLRDETNKVYQHSLFRGVLMNFPDNLKEDSFEIDGIQYKWMTIEAMEADERIMKVNKDVVSLVKEMVQ